MVARNPAPVLLDTHYWIWLQFGIRERLKEEAINIVQAAASEGNLLISIMSVWEVAMLESKGRIQLFKGCAQWIEEALAMPGLALASLTPAIALESTRLPGSFHSDPVDRIIVATARTMGARLLTSDKDIRAYARQHHLLLAL